MISQVFNPSFFYMQCECPLFCSSVLPVFRRRRVCWRTEDEAEELGTKIGGNPKLPARNV